MLEQLDHYNWKEAFGYCGEIEACGFSKPRLVIGAKCSTDPFTREDVKEILFIEEGENDGPNWIGVFELNDGRFACLEVHCDYTGWDCQAGGICFVAETKELIFKFGLSDSARERFGISA